ncbi:peptide chain release factor H [Burkholderia sp. Ac-20379]|uniref:peptide chain release factor H n=1 Tax=Burkholderia sp. Ac-20379 TaxID=2703900 RepID=UPI001D553B88|nr:peptide chain release factor H [Burkholderia sp. Ac-20379]
MLLHLTSAHGPLECQLAVAHALRQLQIEADAAQVALTVLEDVPGERPGTFRSLLVELGGESGSNADQPPDRDAAADALAARWTGTLQWICASPFRARHPRRNWFIGVARCAATPPPPDGEVRFEAMRARGPGGQHVNKTASAIRATHLASGIAVRVESERSQHANRRLALQLLGWRLQQEAEQQALNARRTRHRQHGEVARGNPVRVFRGAAFTPSDG